MVWWQAALWALAGGFVVEGLEFAALQRRHRKWPWQVDTEATEATGAGPLGYFLAELVRLAVGGVLGAALAGQVTGPLPALAIGAAAPIIAGHLTAYLPLPPTPHQVGPADTTSPPAAQTIPENVPPPATPAQPQPRPAPAPEPMHERGGTT
ncbi:hypothetical protein JOF56_001922 [Kibdelosporangium banguiense]|uniref:Uncharacterized protein n=1 Tax=Kibdelosporangium banguiense TaxID=1365924 RepID=A0ABS4TAV9_9PSEU|nr:hypothetical protein [Kibdelosporangium banguiense]MBP2321537.1 hypothetical protein [Kibdelosporangium banguiense]